jgi:hypothetical protein
MFQSSCVTLKNLFLVDQSPEPYLEFVFFLKVKGVDL